MSKTNAAILQQNSTHKAVKENGAISIYAKGFTDGDFSCQDELLYTIPLDQQDDLFAIFERYDEDNRCNVAEANSMFADLSEKQIEALINWAHS